jgi:preprotein translocase subunit Sec61beta
MGEWEDHHMTHLILVPQLILMLSPMVVVVVVLGHLMTHGVQEEDQR